MARARVVGPRNVEAVGDSITETYAVFFFGTDLSAADSSAVTVTIGPADTMVQARDKLVTAVVNEATALGHAVARTRVVIPATERGT